MKTWAWSAPHTLVPATTQQCSNFHVRRVENETLLLLPKSIKRLSERRGDEGAHFFPGKVSSASFSLPQLLLTCLCKGEECLRFPPVRASAAASLGQISMGLMDKQMDLVPRAASVERERGNIWANSKKWLERKTHALPQLRASVSRPRAFFLKFLFEQVTPIMVITIQRIPSDSQGVKTDYVYGRALQPLCHIAPFFFHGADAKPILDR